jgi:hypothetical protein
MNRFKMIFNNSGSVSPQLITSNLGSGIHAPQQRNMSLNAPMIDRVHKARPGCSACGKKVA